MRKRTLVYLLCLLLLSGCMPVPEPASRYFEATVMDLSATYMLVRPKGDYLEGYQGEILQISGEIPDECMPGDRVGISYHPNPAGDSKPEDLIEASAIQLLQHASDIHTVGIFRCIQEQPEASYVRIMEFDGAISLYLFSESDRATLETLRDGDVLIFTYHNETNGQMQIQEILSVEPYWTSQELEKQESSRDIQHFYAYLSDYREDPFSVEIDWIEWIIPRDTTRIAFLGLTEEDFAEGHYILNEKEIGYRYPISEDASLQLFDEESERYSQVSIAEFGAQITMDQESGKSIPYQVTVIDVEVTDIIPAR